MVEIVHMVGHDDGAELTLGEISSVRTRCGRTVINPVVSGEGEPGRYSLVALNGNQFQCTTNERLVTCIKCVNLVTAGSIHVRKSRTADTEKRTMAGTSGTVARSR